MGRSTMFKIPLMLFRFVLIAALSLASSGAMAQKVIPSAPPAAPSAEFNDLDESILYELLLGEIALQRGDRALAAQTYLDVARKTRDPRVVRRAIEIANEARQPEIALQAATLWYEIEPSSPQALQVVAALLIAAKRVEEAEPYIEKLLASDGV